MDTIYIETQDNGNWEYKYKKGLKELTDLYTPRHDGAEVSARVDFEQGLVLLKSNVEQIEVGRLERPYKNGLDNEDALRSFSCAFKIPNSNRHRKKLKMGEEAIYQFDPKICGNFNLLRVWTDRYTNKPLDFYSKDIAFGFR